MGMISGQRGFGFISENAPKCMVCGLNENANTPKFKVCGKGEMKILLLFDSPSGSEDYSGKPFTGNKYNLVSEVFAEKGLSLATHCWKTHTVNCCTEGIPEKKAIKAAEYCQPYTSSAIKKLKPDLIICFGGEASKTILGGRFSDCSAGRWRGIKLFSPEFNAHVMVTYNPGISGGKDEETYAEVISRDIKLALTMLREPKRKKLEGYIETITDFDEVCDRLRYIRKNAIQVALDYETTGLKPNNKNQRIVANAFTYLDKNDGKIYNFSYPISYRGWFTKSQIKEIKKLTRMVLKSDIEKIGHHAKFEEIWGRKKLGVETKNWVWCTLYCAHILDERPNHVSLKTQAFIYFLADAYEEKMKKFLQAKVKGGNELNSVDSAPLMELLYYNGLDTFYTYHLYLKQKEIIAENPSLYFINQLFLDGALVFSDMEDIGFGAIPGYFESKEVEVSKMISDKKKIIMETKEAKKFEKKFKKPFSLNSDDDLSKMIYGAIGIEITKKTGKGKGSTDAEVLMGLEKNGSVWAKEYLEYTKLCTAKDTFISQMLSEISNENIIHPFYHLFTTRTGRSSSSLPNFC